MQTIKQTILTVIICMVVVAGVSVVFAWTGAPPSGPPNDNTLAPINISATQQIKSGPLQVNGFRNIGSSIFDGNVGIGTTNLFHALTVAGNQANAGTDNLAQIMIIGGGGNTNARLLAGYDTTNSKGYIQAVHVNDGYKPLLLNPNGGNVGIGTTELGSKLNVNGDVTISGTNRFINIPGDSSTSGGGLNIATPIYGADTGVNFGSSGNEQQVVFTNILKFKNGATKSGATEKMRIDANGNVGIGTTDPNSSKGTGGYLDVKDVYLRDTGKWASAAGGEDKMKSGKDIVTTAATGKTVCPVTGVNLISAVTSANFSTDGYTCANCNAMIKDFNNPQGCFTVMLNRADTDSGDYRTGPFYWIATY